MVHRGNFVQIINLKNTHWCVVSNTGCCQGEINIYDTINTHVPPSSVPIIASLIFKPLPTLRINMIDVAQQANSCNSTVRLQTNKATPGGVPHKCSFTRFPVEKVFSTRGVTSHTNCSCRMPEIEEEIKIDPMVECEGCGEWFHCSCMDIPASVFTEKDASWKCKYF